MQKPTGCSFCTVVKHLAVFYCSKVQSFSDQGDLNSHDLVIITTSQLINMNVPREFESAVTMTSANNYNGNI